MAKMTQYVVRSAKGLWNGYRWTTEYPEARLFSSTFEPRAIVRVCEFHGTKAEVVADYGLETERVC